MCVCVCVGRRGGGIMERRKETIIRFGDSRIKGVRVHEIGAITPW